MQDKDMNKNTNKNHDRLNRQENAKKTKTEQEGGPEQKGAALE
jgi:hypothetical protein